jgi:hypothetical protein
MKLKGETLFSLILLLVFATAFVLCLGWPAKARMYPLILSAGGFCFAGWLVFAGLSGRLTKKDKPASLKKKLKKKSEVSVRMEIVMVLWLMAFVAVILIFGFWIAIAAFTPIFMRVYGHENWKLIGIFTTAVWFTIYLAFNQGMEVSLFGGALDLTW